jgi:hypothetical protein
MRNKLGDIWTFVSFIFLSLVLVSVISVVILREKAVEEIDALLASDDPSGKLVAALESKNPLVTIYASKALDEIGDPLLLALAPVCKQKGIRSKAYEPNRTGPHPLVLQLVDGKSHKWTYEFLVEWCPKSRKAADVEMVVCAIEREHRLETCRYQFGSERVRIQHELELEIREASTGKLVAKQTLKGSEPDGCPLSVKTDSGTKQISGGSVSEKTVRTWLAGFYE